MKFFLDVKTTPIASATLIARGEMRRDEADYLLDRCADLPRDVRELLINLDGLAVVDPRALGRVVLGMRHWTQARQGRAEFIASRSRLTQAVLADQPAPAIAGALSML